MIYLHFVIRVCFKNSYLLYQTRASFEMLHIVNAYDFLTQSSSSTFTLKPDPYCSVFSALEPGDKTALSTVSTAAIYIISLCAITLYQRENLLLLQSLSRTSWREMSALKTILVSRSSGKRGPQQANDDRKDRIVEKGCQQEC